LRTVFVDTSYHVAVIDARDQHHVLALAAGESLSRENVTFVTTDSVLVEFSRSYRDTETGSASRRRNAPTRVTA